MEVFFCVNGWIGDDSADSKAGSTTNHADCLRDKLRGVLLTPSLMRFVTRAVTNTANRQAIMVLCISARLGRVMAAHRPITVSGPKMEMVGTAQAGICCLICSG